jgi:glycosyltransferase involved in cell wall biosynthesis
MTVAMDRPRVLLVSYLFPPCGGVGVQRALAMARYLPAAGLDVSVLTARDPISQHGSDPDLERLIPPGVHVCHSQAWEPPRAIRELVKRALNGERSAGAAMGAAVQPASRLRRFVKTVVERALFPDAQLLWVKPSIKEAARIIRQEGIGTVILTLPPFSLLFMAVELRKQFPKLRIVLDLRDEWLGYHLPEFDRTASAWKRGHAAGLEKAAVQASDVVVTVTPPWVNSLARRYPDEPASKFICIPNGYDADSLKDFHWTPPPVPPLIVGYMGTVYSNPVYSPAPYLDALEAMPEEWRARVQTRIIGRVAADAVHVLANRTTAVIQTGFLPQVEAFRKLTESHCLLLIIGNPTVHSGKLFEYLAMGIPILAITPPGGEVGRVMRETRAGWCVAAEDRQGIQSAIRDLYEIASGAKSPIEQDRQAVGYYDRRRLAAELARAAGIV